MREQSDMQTHVIYFNKGDKHALIDGIERAQRTLVRVNRSVIVLKQEGHKYNSLDRQLYAPAEFQVYEVVELIDDGVYGGKTWECVVRGKPLVSFPVRG